MADTILEDTMQELADYLKESSNTLNQAMATLGIDEGVDEGKLESRLLEYSIELCVVCGWWCEVGEPGKAAGSVTTSDHGRLYGPGSSGANLPSNSTKSNVVPDYELYRRIGPERLCAVNALPYKGIPVWQAQEEQ